MKKKTNYLGEPYCTFYTEEEEYKMRLELATKIRDTIVKYLGKQRVACSVHSCNVASGEVKFEVYYKDYILYINVLCSSYVEVKEYIPSMKDNNTSFYETEDAVEDFILDSISYNLANK